VGNVERSKFGNLLEAVPDALVGVDKAGVIRLVNHQTESLFGYERADLIGAGIETLVPESLRELHAAHRAVYNATPRTRPMGTDLKLMGRRRDGTEFPADISLAPMNTGGRMLVIAAVRDMTAREKAEKERERLRRESTVVEFGGEAMISTTLDGIITSWNPAAEKLFGWAGEAIIGKTITLLSPEELSTQEMEVLARIEAGETVDDFETVRVREDGTELWASVTVSPIRDTDGKIVGAATTARDVTERRKASELAQRLAAIVDSSDDAIIGKTLDGIITSWNPAAERMYGYCSQEMIDRSVTLLSPQARTGEIAALLAKIRAGEHVHHFETLRVRKDGTLVPVSLTVSPIRDSDGAVIGGSSVGRDMTEQRKALESDRRIAAIVENSNDAIMSITLDGLVTSWNPASEKLFGYTRAEIIGKSIQRVVPEGRIDDVKATLSKIRTGESVEPFETVRVRKDGTQFSASLNVSPLLDTGCAIIGGSAIIRDVTEEKQSYEVAQRMAAMVENSDDAIISYTLDGIISSWNPAAEWLFGCSAEEVIGESGSLVIPDDRADEMQDILTKIKAGQSVRHIETMRMRKDGTEFPVSLTVSPIPDAHGAIIGAVSIARDVTEQREALTAAQRLAAIVEHSDDAIIGKTLDGVITSWNPASERLFGYSSDEIAGQSIEVISPEDRRGEIQAILAKIEAGEHVENFETLRVRKDGRVFPASLTVSPILDSDGSVIGASTIAQDLTRQREASELARSMIEASLDPLVTISLEGKITDVNEATVKVTGVPREELIGTSFSQHFTEPERAEEVYKRVITEGMAVDYPLTLRHQNGDDRLTEVLYNASAYRDAHGDVIGVFAAARDITEQKRAAQYARSLLEAALDPMVTISPEGQITDVNAATLRVTGVLRDKLIGTSFSSYFTEPKKAEAIYQQVFEKGSVTDYPLTLQHQGGGETYTEVLYNASLYRDTSGHVLGVFASARDVTKQILAQREAAHQQARELDRLAELERFQRLTVGRELRMIELKKEIEYLKKYGQAKGEPHGQS
jgi:PAS domain S-box-containing protein